MRRQPGDDERHVHVRETRGGDRRVDTDERLEPFAEARSIETFFCAGTVGLPEIEIEDGRELLGRRQRQQRAALLKSTVRDDGVQDLGRQARHGTRELRIAGDAGEDAVAGAVLGHGPAMIPALNCKKQS